MLLRVDTTSATPVYSQIISQTKHAIASGVLREGDFLPSLRDTAKELRVNPHTVAKAYRELEVLGLVRTDQGRGTYVTGSGVERTDAYIREELERLCEQLVVEGYHLGASPEQIIEIVGQKLTALLGEFESRDAGKVEDANE